MTMRYVKIAAHYKVKAVEKLEEYRQQIQLLCSSIRSVPECSADFQLSSPRKHWVFADFVSALCTKIREDVLRFETSEKARSASS